MYGLQFFGFGRKQASQAAEACNEVTSQIDSAFAAHAHAQKDGQQLSIGQGRSALRQQSFAGTLMYGPVGD
jgi:D-arabinose 5-phosphate isomerase GutQ